MQTLFTNHLILDPKSQPSLLPQMNGLIITESLVSITESHRQRSPLHSQPIGGHPLYSQAINSVPYLQIWKTRPMFGLWHFVHQKASEPSLSLRPITRGALLCGVCSALHNTVSQCPTESFGLSLSLSPCLLSSACNAIVLEESVRAGVEVKVDALFRTHTPIERL